MNKPLTLYIIYQTGFIFILIFVNICVVWSLNSNVNMFSVFVIIIIHSLYSIDVSCRYPNSVYGNQMHH